MSTSVSWERARIEVERERRRRKSEGMSGREVEIEQCRADAGYFIDTYGVIDDSQGIGIDDGSGTTPFKLWDDQRQVLKDIHENRRVIILKSRQLGISWTVIGYIWWLIKWHDGQIALLLSLTEDDAKELIRRIGVLEARLPQWLRDVSPLAKPPNAASIVYANGSRVTSRAATPTAGSGQAASIVLMDEAAKMQWARPLFTSIKPTVEAGRAKLILLSTAYGTGNLFHDVWTMAIAGTNKFKAIFLPWWSRPGRDQAWYDERVAEAVDPSEVKQEHPSNPTESFLVSGRMRFVPEWIARQAANIAKVFLRRGHQDYPKAVTHDDGLVIYEGPFYGRKYIVSADVAEGVEGGDYSTAVVLDRATKTEHACLHGHWEPDEFGLRLNELHLSYDADVIVERNNHGHAVLLKLKELKCKKIADGPDGKPGWLTNAQTKPQAIDLLAEALRDDAVAVRSQATLDEMQIYTVMNGGKTSAPAGKHDDRVMSWAIGLAWLRLCGMTRSMTPGRNPVAGYRG
jgi:hypothetical protein